ncbi:energy transducer TonB family protein [Maribacter sp. CXY002]|uniref:energy transducer TonB family protein n=1 Tax=Maribacter luteocoastalis TaxID=3407671 RepID=UPI003B685EEF
MNLNRQQLSLIITIFSMAIIVLVLYNIHLGAEEEKDEDYVVEMVLDEERIEELEQEEKLHEELSNADPIKSHMAFNETAKPSYGNPEPLKTLEEILEEKEAMNDSEVSDQLISDSEYAAKVKELAKKREEIKQSLGEKEAKKEEFTNNLADKRTSISYSLIDRNSYKLPPPIYTCIEGGKVVINIEVDALGYVTEADFNAKSSGTSNGCLVDNAIAYALKAKFSPSERATQKGTITYLFQGK